MRITFLTSLFCLFLTFTWAQLPVPENGLAPSEPKLIALKNIQIIVSSEKTIEKGTMLIEDGQIIKIGAIITIPKEAVVFDMSGKTVVPSFIESHSNIGLPEVKSSKWNPRPQLESKKDGAYYWNETIQPEINAAEHYRNDEKASKQLQEMGFGVAVTHRQDGLMRGTGAAIVLGVDHRKGMIANQTAAFFSFKKGVSKQTYPSSQMGAIALIRQTLYDAQYYEANKNNLPSNLSLEALNNQLKLPLVFEVSDKLEVLRAQKIADEFGLNFIVLGGGNEYERLDKLKNRKTPLVIPIDFPDAYDVKDPFVSRQIPLSDLKHWEIAPANPYFLSKNKIPFAITSKGHNKPADFWKHLHQAIENGLTREEAIAALTSIPATLFNLTNFGTLEEGKSASFSVFNKDPFVYKDTKIEEVWAMGKQSILNEVNTIDVRGKYNLTISGKTIYPLIIKGEKDKLSAKILLVQSKENENGSKQVDTVKTDVTIDLSGTDLSLNFNVDDDKFKGAFTLHGKINAKLGVIEGQGSTPEGNWIKWAAIKNDTNKDTGTSKKITVDTLSKQNIWYPNMAYGFEHLPKKKTYILRNATLWTNEKEGIVKDGTVILKDGKISFVGKGNYVIPASAEEIDAKGLHITSGIIDEHSHIAISKGVNEGGQANSAEVSIKDVVRSDDINIYRQLSGGVTASQLLHGSANPIGGQSALIKLKWGYAPEEMLIPNQPKFIKFALGENVKQANWGDYRTVRFPQTRMGVEQLFYDAFIRAKAYHEEWETYNNLTPKQREKQKVTLPARDLELEIVWEIMNQERFISCHSYVQSEINMLMHVADSMGFVINTFTHILEGYKLADKMLKHGAGGSTFSDWWAYKFEVNDAIPYNASLMHEQGIVVAINSDDAEMGRRLNQEAAKVLKYGGGKEEDVWKMVTLNPAKLLHLDDRMGSLKVGKDADVVIWTDNPLSINAKVVSVFIDGELMYDYKIDQLNRSKTQQEKARIINKMLADNKNGSPTKPFVKKKEKHWHCDTIGEHESEGHGTNSH